MCKTKRLLSVVLALLMICSIMVALPTSVSAATSGYYEYKVLENDTVEITKYTGSEKELEIPNKLDDKQVTKIGEGAFEYRLLSSITIPNSVTSIGKEAFSGCKSLTSVTIPDSVTSIGEWAFNNCNSLANITIQDGVTNIGDYAFSSCESLTSVTIPNSVTSLGRQAFGFCRSLANISIPDSVASIGDYAFDSCESLTSVTIGNGVTSIGYYAFYGCPSLTDISVASGNTYYSSVEGNLYNKTKTELIWFATGKKDKSFIIPDSVTSIGDSAFSGYNLTSVTIPDSVTSIGKRAFSGNLTDISVASGNMNYSSIDGNLYNKAKTELIQYAKGKRDKSFMIPYGVTSIGERAFSYCKSLASITIPDGVTSIGDFAFSGCNNLTSIIIPDSVWSIGESVFFSCTLLDLYYTGSYSDWDMISIARHNDQLYYPKFHYNYIPTEVTLSESSVKLYTTAKHSIKATVKYPKENTTFRSSNTKVATVTENGQVKALKKGTAYITVTNNGVSKQLKVTVINPSLKKKSAVIRKNKTVKISVKGSGKFTFTSKNKKIATVTSKGVVKGKSKGKTFIKVKANGKTLKFKVTVLKK